MSNDGSWIIATGSILDHSGSGNADPEVNFGVNYNSKSQITIRVGAMARVTGASAGGRQHNIEFFCVTNYLSPDTYGLDSDSDGIANHLDLDSDNDGIYDAVEAGHNQPHTNGVVNSGYGANGLANIVETSPESGVINYSIRNTDGTAPPDYLDEDSDDDGCKDANEAYGNVTADSDGNGYYGSGNPPAVNSDGTVTAASYSNPVDGDSNGTPDYVEAEAAPLITTQPTDTVICANGNTSFSVTASNVNTYQWQIYNGSVWNDVTDTGIHSGATTNTLGITNGQMSDNGNQYRVIVSNTSFICSLETSNTVTLTVVQPIAPVSGGDQEECADSPVQTLTATATVPAGSNLVWFDAPVGGNVVASPTLNSVGTITYYAESQDGSTACPSSTRTPVSLTIHPRPTISVTGSASCNIFLTAYSLEVTVSSGTVSSTAGTVINTAGNVWDITDVPSGTDIVVTVTDANGCSRDLPVSAPDCSCPVVNAPNSGGDKAYCTGDPVPSIDASVEVGETVDWYDSASGGVLLLSGNTSFTPSGAGTYYAEARNSITNCISGSRTPITVIEDSPPTATISADRTVFVNQNTSFTVITTNADTYQWQLSTDGGTVFNNIVNGPEYSGTQSISLTVNAVDIDKNNNRYRLLASKSGSSCALIASPSALLRVRVRTVITNRRITHRVKKN
ncbi:immunoglobulin domain-containing protein [Arenibacter sp. 6A1]|uniref:immunoglobulin domain-containing protein n=1 Tax=Arenibacter sp. 6A1 TaxID=2720391 RepID=UPI001447B2FD|nr:immunoglobulin domain-containing protein [Arenibacter sp. 6A1]NKI27748.1 immunoglobulin domain-containing protein [Arenibacter sp. 6A1]